MATETGESFKSIKNDVIQAAKDLNYKPEVIMKLSFADRVEELNQIMIDARHGIYDAENRRYFNTGSSYQKTVLQIADLSDCPRLSYGFVTLNDISNNCRVMVENHLVYGRSLDKAYLAGALRDIMMSIAIGADAIGYDLEDILKMGIDKLAYEYPHAFTDNKNHKRKTKKLGD